MREFNGIFMEFNSCLLKNFCYNYGKIKKNYLTIINNYMNNNN